MLRKLLFAFFLLATSLCLAQSTLVGDISGTVRSSDGEPLKGRVALFDYDKLVWFDTDNKGRFLLKNVPFGSRKTILAEAEQFARDRRENVVVFPGRVNNIGDIVLEPGIAYSGRVVDAKGSPIEGAIVEVDYGYAVLSHTIASMGKWKGKTDSEGRFRTPALAEGRWRHAFAYAPDKVKTWIKLPLFSTAELPDVILADDAPFHGQVINNEGKAVAGATIVMNYDYDRPAKTDENGKFVLRGFPSDATEIYVEAPEHEAQYATADRGAAPAKIQIPVRRAFEGRVTDADTGEPVSFNFLQLCRVERDAAGKPSMYG